MPTKIESFGVSALEAAGCGIPVIASNAGGIPEAVSNGYNGLLFTSGDQDALAESILRLAKNENLRSTLAGNGPQWVHDNFRLENCYQEINDLYYKLVD
jgi:L-malate glycosyltransferase